MPIKVFYCPEYNRIMCRKEDCDSHKLSEDGKDLCMCGEEGAVCDPFETFLPAKFIEPGKIINNYSDNILLETLYVIRDWIKDGGFVEDVHYDDQSIIEEIEKAIKKHELGVVEWNPIETAPEGPFLLFINGETGTPFIDFIYDIDPVTFGKKTGATGWLPLPKG